MDAEQWAAKATRPIMGPGVNVWLLARRSDDDVSEKEVETSAADALAYWLGFAHRSMMTGVRILSTVTSHEEPTIQNALSFRREDLPELPLIRGGKAPWFVVLTFSSTLGRTELPWPVITRDTFGWDYAPSSAAEWMLVRAAKPRPMTAEEKPLTGMESLKKEFSEASESVSKAMKPGINIVLVVAVVAAALAALSYFRKAAA